jgi:predicted small metal-binding protein
MSNSKRKFVDCRDMPSEKNCTVRISGSEEEVVIVAARHAVEEHGHQDTPELRREIKKALKDEIEA